MVTAFTTLWTEERIRILRQDGQLDAIAELLLGGPHTSQPSFVRAGVQPGDWIYPVHVKNGVLHAVTRMRVKEILSAEQYIARNLEVFAGFEPQGYPALVIQAYFQSHPSLRYLHQSCTDEVVLGEAGAPIRLDRTVPPALVEQIRYRSQRKERPIKHLQDGKITRVISLHGIYRLSPGSAEMIASLF